MGNAGCWAEVGIGGGAGGRASRGGCPCAACMAGAYKAGAFHWITIRSGCMNVCQLL